MDTYGKVFFQSDRWINFVESTALALQLNITLIDCNTDNFHKVTGTCPFCRSEFPGLTPKDLSTAKKNRENNLFEFVAERGVSAVIIPLHGNLSILACECSCKEQDGRLSLQERAGIARKLLTSFQISLNEGIEGGHKKIELSILRQMHHIVLTLFQEENKAVEHAFDLILSALVILLDAGGSWLTYKKPSEEPVLIVKGDRSLVEKYMNDQAVPAAVAEIKNGIVRGQLGVIAPGDQIRADYLLSLMVRECTIIFEVDRLFKFLHTQLNRVLGSVGNAILMVNRYGYTSYANKAAAKLLGRSAVNIIGRPVADITGPWTPFIKAKTKNIINGQMDPVNTDCGVRYIDWQVCPLMEEEKEKEDNEFIAGWLILAEDRTDYQKWQEAARQAERMAMTATMVGTLAHELRNPLSAAKGLLQLINRNREPEKIKGYTDLILRELDRVTNLLNEFLLLGRPADISSRPLDLAEFIKDLMPLFEDEAGTGTEIFMTAEEVPPVAADPGQLTQVLLNLVRNAIEAAGHKGRVVLNLQKVENRVAISVRDDGPGLSPDALDNLFQPFFTTKERGTGLGLPVTQAIIYNHNGQITAANHPEGGAVFTIILPVHPGSNKTGARIDVLIATANEMVRYPLQQALQAANINVISTPNLNDALAWSEILYPVIIILEQKDIFPHDLKQVQRVWPESTLLTIGKQGIFKDIQALPRPQDCSQLVSKIRFLLESQNYCH